MDCSMVGTAWVGVREIDELPSGALWNPGLYCSAYEPGSPFLNNNDEVQLFSILNSPYDPNGINPKHWWIEMFGNDVNKCIDDHNQSSEMLGNCLKFDRASLACRTTAFVQLVSECDRCVNNARLGGTWFKGQIEIDLMNLGGACGAGVNMMILQLMDLRTNCDNENKP